jgi:hypothetical protein
MQTLLIIFGISLFGILVMIYRGVSRVRKNNIEHEEGSVHPMGKHVQSIGKQIGTIFRYIAHSFAILVSRLWARISYRVSVVYGRIVTKIENYFKHKHEDNINKDVKTQSILLTTIKAYKKEIKKLNRKIEPDEMRPKDETKKD